MQHTSRPARSEALVKTLEQSPQPVDFLTLLVQRGNYRRPVYRVARVVWDGSNTAKIKFNNWCERCLHTRMEQIHRKEDPLRPWHMVAIVGEELLRILTAGRRGDGWIIAVLNNTTCHACTYDYGRVRKHRGGRDVQAWEEKPFHKR